VEKPFGALVAVGLSLMLVLQAMVNMAVAVNLVPVTGQPLPLVSMGGTSVWFTCLAIGIVLSVSRSLDEPSTPSTDVKRPRTAQQLRVMISGGGTGGHIFPAIAIANAVRERELRPNSCSWVRKGKMEMEKVPAAGYRIEALPIRGFQRGSIVKNIGLPWRLLRSMMEGAEPRANLQAPCGRGCGRICQRSVARRCPAHERAHLDPGTEQLPGKDQHPPGSPRASYLCGLRRYGALLPEGEGIPDSRATRCDRRSFA
jgi:hypothetical protein